MRQATLSSSAPWLAVPFLAAFVLLATPVVASAHARSTSYAMVVVQGSAARIELRFSELDRSALAAAGFVGPDQVASYFQRGLELRRGEEACFVDGAATPLTAARGSARLEWTASCGTQGDFVLRSELAHALPGHSSFASVSLDGGAAFEHVLSERSPEVELAFDAEPLADGLGAWVVLGVHHILSGADHLVFLLVLLLMAARVRDVALVVTGFTVGHSATLALAAFGLVSPDGAVVEALIGLSIVLLAVENVWLHRQRRDPGLVYLALGAVALLALGAGASAAGLALFGVAVFWSAELGLLARSERPERVRWVVAALFGLVHGFGFAGALASTPLPLDTLYGALFGFNLGVELGQLALVALAFPLLLLARRARRVERWLVPLGSAAAAATGVFWLASRLP